ncbi:DUF6923 family protein [Saccharothrix sp. Mg75]|uniref:DUF6923 family protein n=1 Tax=Saccharothrix sp. Mg75 TaxID=3445357 RepID=UPI003EF070C7
MIELLAQVACTTIQVEANHGPSSVLQVTFPEGTTTGLGVLDRRLNAIGYSHAQNLVYGVDDDGRLVALDRSGRLVGTPSRPSPLLRHAKAGAVVGERLVVRVGHALFSVGITPGPRFGKVVHEAVMWPAAAVTVDDFDLNAADGLLYGVATHWYGHGVVVTIDPDSGRVRKVPGVGHLPGGHGYGAVTLSPDGSLYATNNRHDGRSTLYRVALDGSGVVTEISSRQTLRTIDSSGCLFVPPPAVDPPDPTPEPTPGPTPGPGPIPGPAPTTTVPPPGPQPVVPPPPGSPPPGSPRPGSPPPATTPVPPPPATTAGPTPTPPRPTTVRMPERHGGAVAVEDNTVRDQRRWGLVALLLILGMGAAAGSATARRPR